MVGPSALDRARSAATLRAGLPTIAKAVGLQLATRPLPAGMTSVRDRLRTGTRTGDIRPCEHLAGNAGAQAAIYTSSAPDVLRCELCCPVDETAELRTAVHSCALCSVTGPYVRPWATADGQLLLMAALCARCLVDGSAP